MPTCLEGSEAQVTPLLHVKESDTASRLHPQRALRKHPDRDLFSGQGCDGGQAGQHLGVVTGH